MFQNFEVTKWPDFEQNASKVLADGSSRPIPHLASAAIISAWESYDHTPRCERQLGAAKSRNVLEACNYLARIAGSSNKWSVGNPRQMHSYDDGNSICDFSLGSDNGYIAGGGLESPKLKLGSDHLTLPWLKDNLSLPWSDLQERNDLNPYFQLFSNMITTETGLGVLSNYDDMRMYKLNLRQRRIYMSPVVRIDQKLDVEENKPHALQALMYLAVADHSSNDFNRSLADTMVSDAKKTLKEKEKSTLGQDLEEISDIPDSSDAGTLLMRSKAVSESVARVVRKSTLVGHLGQGMCGRVLEYDYEGLPVAVKLGCLLQSFDDCEFTHVENELEVYEALAELQGNVIPQLIAGGYGELYCLNGMIMATEKVGFELEESSRDRVEGMVGPTGGLYVCGRMLREEDADEIEREAVKGLQAIHAMGVVHGDVRPANMRVEKKNGAWRVWWIHFRNGRTVRHPRSHELEEVEFRKYFAPFKQNARILHSK